jgi:hypothetical protein
MPLWGVTTSDESKPKWLTQEQKARCFATQEGWVLRHYKSADESEYWDEVLVTTAGLANTLANSNITLVYFSNAASAYVQGFTNAFVTVVFNEKVNVTGSPTLNVVGGTTNATATYNAGTGTNKLKFKFTVPAQTQTMNLANQSIALAGGTINDVSANTAATLSFTSAVVANVALGATGNTTISVA